MILHITNGDSAIQQLRAAEVPGELLPWNDVLHEGPVPAGLSLDELRPVRAAYAAEQGWAAPEAALRGFAERDAALAGFAAHAEVVLWFERDLYDQLQLIQLLDWFAGRPLGGTRLSLVGTHEYLGDLPPARLAEYFRVRPAATPEQLALGQAAWAAFRSPEPAAIAALLREDTSALPFLAGALYRHLQEFPSAFNGLSRSESQALEALAAGPRTVGETYDAAHHRREDPVFLGDSVFASYVARLSQVASPLVLGADGEVVAVPREPDALHAFWQSDLLLTEAGQAVLAGQADHVRLNGVDRWLGGVHLAGRAAPWRWDEPAGRLRRADR